LRVSKRDHDGQWESLRNSYDDNSDTDDDVVDPELQVFRERTVLVRLSAKEVNVALQNTVQEVTEKEDVHSQEGCVGTNLTDLRSDNLQLHLQGSVLGSLLEFGHDFAERRVLTDHDNEHFTVAASH
jgi:hypothetical protein